MEVPDGTQRLRLTVMTAQEFEGWRDGLSGDFADELGATGLSDDDASDQAELTLNRLLPQGLRTPDNLLWSVREDADLVGVAWMMLRKRSSSTEAVVRDLYIEQRARRQGRGRALLQILEREARERGAAHLSFRFFGRNTAAKSMCDSLGFEVSSVTMYKRLTG